MTRSEVWRQHAFFSQRKLNPRSQYPVATNHHAEIVKGAVRPEDCLKQSRADRRIESLSSLHQSAESHTAFDGDQRTELVFPQEMNRITDGGHDFSHILTGSAEDSRMTETNHGLAKLGLKDDDQKNGQKAEKTVINEIELAKGVATLSEDADGEGEQHQQHGKTLDHTRPPGAPKEAINHVHAEPDDRQLEEDFEWVITVKKLKTWEHVSGCACVKGSPCEVYRPMGITLRGEVNIALNMVFLPLINTLESGPEVELLNVDDSFPGFDYDPGMSRFGSEYHISRPTGQCAATDQLLPPGAVCIATLCENPEDDSLVRRDYSLEAWEDGVRPEGLFSYWKAIVPQPNDRRGGLVDDEVLRDLFERLANDERPQRISFRFVLALILMRKRYLKFVGRQAVEGDRAERWLMRHKGAEPDDPPIEVINPHLSDDDVRDLTEQLSEILQSEL